MDENKEYFIRLVSDFLNSRTPEACDGVNWNEIYRLSDIHNMCAIAANEVLLLEKDKRPEKNILSLFKQQLGLTIINSKEKDELISLVRNIFNECKIDFIFLKGAVIKDLYPVSEFRTSGDIDIFVKSNDFEKAKDLFKSKPDRFSVCHNTTRVCNINYGDIQIELHTADDADNSYFSDIFEIAEGCDNSFEYKLSNENHLLYVLCHIAKHFNQFGAGVRMFADIDVLLRHIDDFDYDTFIDKCKKAGIEVFAKYAFSFCRYRFDTPIKAEIDFDCGSEVTELFENTVIDGGSFGYASRTHAEHYLKKNVNKNGKITFISKIKAFISMVFPSAQHLKMGYSYAMKHPVLLPIAWANRIIDAIKNKNIHSIKTAKKIFANSDDTEQYALLLKELDIR